MFWLLQIFDIFEENTSVEMHKSSKIYASWKVKLPGIYMSRCDALISPEDSGWTRGSDNHIMSAERLLFCCVDYLWWILPVSDIRSAKAFRGPTTFIVRTAAELITM